MRLVAFACIRDERDIVEAFVRHTLASASQIYVLDHGSSDGTSAILAALREEGLPLTVLRDETLGNCQALQMTRLLRRAVSETGADWFLPLDADEFLQSGFPAEAMLQDADPHRPLALRWRGYVPQSADDSAEANPLRRIRCRRVLPEWEDAKVLIPRRVAIQPDVQIRQGSHGVLIGGVELAPAEHPNMTLAHFPVRSRDQYLAKMTIRALQYRLNPERDPASGWTFDDTLKEALRDPERVADSYMRAARRYGLAETVPDDFPLVVDPIDYRGGPLKYSAESGTVDSAFRKLLALTCEVVEDRTSGPVASQPSAASQQRERLLRDQMVAIRRLEQQIRALEAERDAARDEARVHAEIPAALRRSWTWRVGRWIVGPIARFRAKLRTLRSRRPKRQNVPPLVLATRVCLGAAGKTFPGWFSTDRAVLDVTRRSDFAGYWTPDSRDAFVAEHVWEHLSADDAVQAIQNCFEFLRPGGRLRVAVPDGLHPDPAYREWVRPGGNGPGADDHRQLYDYRTLLEQVRAAGFRVQLLEHWDESGQFHRANWSWDDGPVRRSSRYDPRNVDGVLRYTSLVVDAIKPAN